MVRPCYARIACSRPIGANRTSAGNRRGRGGCRVNRLPALRYRALCSFPSREDRDPHGTNPLAGSVCRTADRAVPAGSARSHPHTSAVAGNAHHYRVETLPYLADRDCNMAVPAVASGIKGRPSSHGGSLIALHQAPFHVPGSDPAPAVAQPRDIQSGDALLIFIPSAAAAVIATSLSRPIRTNTSRVIG